MLFSFQTPESEYPITEKSIPFSEEIITKLLLSIDERMLYAAVDFDKTKFLPSKNDDISASSLSLLNDWGLAEIETNIKSIIVNLLDILFYH